MIYGLSNVSICYKTRNFSMGLDHAVVDEITECVNIELSKVNKIKR